MGNSQTKESRSNTGRSSRRDSNGGSPVTQTESAATIESSTRPQRPRRGSRPDFTSFLGIGGSSDQDASSLETRRENKVEREARKAEKEKQTRLKERERSMKEEHVDGGYLVTLGVYVGVEDYSKPIVRQLMIERRLAPFWRGLNDYSESWAEHQIMAAARGMPIPPADEVPPELEYTLIKRTLPEAPKDKVKGMTIPIGSRTESFQSEQSGRLSPINNSLPLPSPPAQSSSVTSGGPLLRARAKTLASLTSSRNNEQKDMNPREFQLPPDPFVNGQPVEVYLYKDAVDCPICFLSYPPYLNTTRCCEQPICSECFVQIKRPDPHPPEHEQPDPNAPPLSEEERASQAEGQLVSEVATCPYCKQPEFGITYTPPPFRRGLTYGTGSQPYQVRSAMSSQTSIASGQMSPNPNRRRGTSLSATAPEVITTDKIRPDWASKLAAARAHAARRSAAATALHAAAYLMNGQNERSTFPSFGRRNMLRRATLEGDERTAEQQRGLDALREAGMFLPPPRGSSSRRNRMDDLEDMMMMEAIRLSLAAEEERRKKEEKEAKKKAKKAEKETKKAEKAARKNTLTTVNSNSSTGEPLTLTKSNSSSHTPDDTTNKGKGVERTTSQLNDFSVTDTHQPRSSALTSMLQSETSQESLSSGMAAPSAIEPLRRSHLRQMSNASSASSSFVDPGTSFPGSSTPPGNAGLEPMFNFRSLTAMISEDEKADDAHVEHAEDRIGRQGSFENLEDQPQLSMETSSNAANGSAKSHHAGVGKQPAVSIETTKAPKEPMIKSAGT